MENKIKSFLFHAHLPPEERKNLQRDMARSAYVPTLIAAVLIILFELALLFFSLGEGGYGHAAPPSMYLTLLLLTLAFGTFSVVFGRRLIREAPGFLLGLYWIYALIICLWGGAITVLTQGETSNISVLIYVSLGVALLVPLRPAQALTLYALNFLDYILLLNFFGDPGSHHVGSRVNSIIVSVLSAAIASTLYYNRAQNFCNRMTILKQNEQITSINEQLRALVLLDELTNARNRRFFEEVVSAHLRMANEKRCAVCLMMIDIDHFKQYNDLYGHPRGDACLQRIVGTMTGLISEERNEFFIRYGGEEFLFFHYGRSREEYVQLAERLRGAVSGIRVEHTGSGSGHVTVSIGVHCQIPGDGTTLQELVRLADAALYEAKNAGRDCVRNTAHCGETAKE